MGAQFGKGEFKNCRKRQEFPRQSNLSFSFEIGGFCRVSLPRDIFYLTYGKRNAAALSYRLSENRYEAKFFEAVCEGGKVTNVRPVPEEE